MMRNQLDDKHVDFAASDAGLGKRAIAHRVQRLAHLPSHQVDGKGVA